MKQKIKNKPHRFLFKEMQQGTGNGKICIFPVLATRSLIDEGAATAMFVEQKKKWSPTLLRRIPPT
jgi:hypothetical protein